MSEFVPILTAAITGCTRCGCAVASPLIPTHRKVCPGKTEPPEVLTVSPVAAEGRPML